MLKTTICRTRAPT